MELYRKKVRSLGFGKEGFERVGIYMEDITDRKIDFLTAQDTSSNHPVPNRLKDTCLVGSLIEKSSAKRNVVSLPTPYVKEKGIGVGDMMKIVIDKNEVYMNKESEEERNALSLQMKREAQQFKKNIKKAQEEGHYSANVGGKDSKHLKFKKVTSKEK